MREILWCASPHANAACLCAWCTGVCISDVLGEDESRKGYLYADLYCAVWRQEQRHEDPFFLRLIGYEQKSLSTEHWTKPKREICVIFNQPEKNEASSFLFFLFLMQVVTSVNLPPEGGHVTGVFPIWSLAVNKVYLTKHNKTNLLNTRSDFIA